MKINFSAMVSRVCAVGLAILGFGCSSDDPGDDGDLICMYGTPTGSWEIHGSVKTQKGEEVKDATIRVSLPGYDSDPNSISTTDTDSEGAYTVEGHVLSNKLKVVCVPDNPALDADSTEIELKYKKDKNDKNSWYRGHAEAKVDFKLNPKANDDESLH